MHRLDRAIEIAMEAHAGQSDKTGEPYYLHCNRVAAAVPNIDEKIVAYLDDVVEKAGWSLERVANPGKTFRTTTHPGRDGAFTTRSHRR